IEEIEVDLEHSTPMRDRKCADATRRQVQRRMPGVVLPGALGNPDLADDLRPPVERCVGVGPGVEGQRRPDLRWGIARGRHSCANWMTTLMSSACRWRARINSSGGTLRVRRPASHAGSARASTCPALYQCRLLAFTLPTTTLLRSTTLEATSAVGRPR